MPIRGFSVRRAIALFFCYSFIKEVCCMTMNLFLKHLEKAARTFLLSLWRQIMVG